MILAATAEWFRHPGGSTVRPGASAMRPSANFRQSARSATVALAMYPRLYFFVVLIAAALVVVGASAPKAESTPIPPAQLDALVAPIALYPDPLLAQTMAASTYPLEI